MDRRTFIAGSLAGAAGLAVTGRASAARRLLAGHLGAAELPALGLTLTDAGFAFDRPLTAGRFEMTVANAGTSPASHFGLGRVPDRVTDAQYEAWLDSPEGETEDLTFEEIAFVGAPDWPAPGGEVSGVVDIAPGRYFLFDPFDGREAQTLIVAGELAPAAEPAADLTVTLREMEIVLPEAAFTSAARRWKIENTGAMSHEVAVLPVAPEFTAEHLKILAGLPFDAAPPPEVPELVYQPVAAIGILAGRQTSWLDVELKPGRYLAACMLPFSTGYPHVMDGMFRFFDVG